jgi:hypothetical protein
MHACGMGTCVTETRLQAPERDRRLSAYRFVGQLMGLAIRTQSPLPFMWPSLVWKQFVNDPLTEQDYKANDEKEFMRLQTLASDIISTEELVTGEIASFGCFVAEPFGGSTPFPLVPGGAQQRITMTNRHAFVKALQDFRLSEFREQCTAMRQGLATVVPYQCLSLMTWVQLERWVCGSAFSCEQVAILQRHTHYQNCKADDPHIRWFWEMLRDRFTDKHRTDFLSFAWGRSRLPASDEAWQSTHMTICSIANKETSLPLSHTCSFQLDLPRYASLEIMVKKFHQAILETTFGIA